MGDQNGGPDADGRQSGREHARGQAGDDVGGRAGLRGVGDFMHRAAVFGRVVFRQHADAHAGRQTGNGGHKDIEGFGRHKQAADRIGGRHHDDRRAEGADIQGRLRVAAFACFDEEGAADRDHNADAGQDEGQQHFVDAVALIQGRRAEHHGADNRADIGFEQVCAHAGHVADIVADVVGDGGGVARIVFRNARFHFAHQIGADIGRFGVDAAAHAGEERDGRSAHGEAVNDREHRCAQDIHARAEDLRINDQEDGKAEHAQTHNAHAHDRAAREGDLQRLRQSGAGAVGGAHVGRRGDLHADVAGRAGAERTDHEGQRHQTHAALVAKGQQGGHGHYEDG